MQIHDIKNVRFLQRKLFKRQFSRRGLSLLTVKLANFRKCCIPTELARHFTLLKSRVSGHDWQKHCRHYAKVRRNSLRCTSTCARESMRAPLFRSKKFKRGYVSFLRTRTTRTGRLFFHFRPVLSPDCTSFVWLKPREPIRKVRQSEIYGRRREEAPVLLREIPLGEEDGALPRVHSNDETEVASV